MRIVFETKDKKYRIVHYYEEKGNYAYVLKKKKWYGWKLISHGYTFDQCYYDLCHLKD